MTTLGARAPPRAFSRSSRRRNRRNEVRQVSSGILHPLPSRTHPTQPERVAPMLPGELTQIYLPVHTPKARG